MTILGKILTFFIFFFSLVFLGFAFSINQLNKEPQTGKSWVAAFEGAKREVNALKADLAARDNEIADLRGKLSAQTQLLKTTVDQANLRVDDAYKKQSEAESRAKSLAADFMNAQAATQAALNELELRRKENSELVERLKVRESELARQTASVTRANNERVQSQVEAASYRGRLEKMEKDYADLARAYEQEIQRKAERSLETGQKTPPPDDVQGEVEAVTTDGYIQISIGSDAGLLRGHVLKVFRLKPDSTFLGEIQIIDVWPHKAVGKLMPSSSTQKKVIKVGDKVANRIMTTISK